MTGPPLILARFQAQDDKKQSGTELYWLQGLHNSHTSCSSSEELELGWLVTPIALDGWWNRSLLLESQIGPSGRPISVDVMISTRP